MIAFINKQKFANKRIIDTIQIKALNSSFITKSRSHISFKLKSSKNNDSRSNDQAIITGKFQEKEIVSIKEKSNENKFNNKSNLNYFRNRTNELKKSKKNSNINNSINFLLNEEEIISSSLFSFSTPQPKQKLSSSLSLSSIASSKHYNHQKSYSFLKNYFKTISASSVTKLGKEEHSLINEFNFSNLINKVMKNISKINVKINPLKNLLLNYYNKSDLSVFSKYFFLNKTNDAEIIDSSKMNLSAILSKVLLFIIKVLSFPFKIAKLAIILIKDFIYYLFYRFGRHTTDEGIKNTIKNSYKNNIEIINPSIKKKIILNDIKEEIIQKNYNTSNINILSNLHDIKNSNNSGSYINNSDKKFNLNVKQTNLLLNNKKSLLSRLIGFITNLYYSNKERVNNSDYKIQILSKNFKEKVNTSSNEDINEERKFSNNKLQFLKKAFLNILNYFRSVFDRVNEKSKYPNNFSPSDNYKELIKVLKYYDNPLIFKYQELLFVINTTNNKKLHLKHFSRISRAIKYCLYLLIILIINFLYQNYTSDSNIEGKDNDKKISSKSTVSESKQLPNKNIYLKLKIIVEYYYDQSIQRLNIIYKKIFPDKEISTNIIADHLKSLINKMNLESDLLQLLKNIFKNDETKKACEKLLCDLLINERFNDEATIFGNNLFQSILKDKAIRDRIKKILIEIIKSNEMKQEGIDLLKLIANDKECEDIVSLLLKHVFQREDIFYSVSDLLTESIIHIINKENSKEIFSDFLATVWADQALRWKILTKTVNISNITPAEIKIVKIDYDGALNGLVNENNYENSFYKDLDTNQLMHNQFNSQYNNSFNNYNQLAKNSFNYNSYSANNGKNKRIIDLGDLYSEMQQITIGSNLIRNIKKKEEEDNNYDMLDNFTNNLERKLIIVRNNNQTKESLEQEKERKWRELEEKEIQEKIQRRNRYYSEKILNNEYREEIDLQKYKKDFDKDAKSETIFKHFKRHNFKIGEEVNSNYNKESNNYIQSSLEKMYKKEAEEKINQRKRTLGLFEIIRINHLKYIDEEYGYEGYQESDIKESSPNNSTDDINDYYFTGNKKI